MDVCVFLFFVWLGWMDGRYFLPSSSAPTMCVDSAYAKEIYFCRLQYLEETTESATFRHKWLRIKLL